MASRHWSTRAVPRRDQFAFWREAVCEAVLNVATERPADGFCGDITCADYGDLRFAAFASTAHEIVRQKAHIGRSRDAHYLISWQRSGTSRMSQGVDDCELRPGDIGLIDGTRPFRVAFSEAVDRVVAVIPHAQLHSRAPWLDRRPLNRIDAAAPLAGMLHRYLERLSGAACRSDVEALALSDNVCNLVALMTAASEGERSRARQLAPRLGLDEMLAMLRSQLARPDLSPSLLAERLRVSVRTVHKRFEEADTTFGQWVLEQRLQACRRALGDPRQQSLTVSQIAFGWGFNDLSHFSKSFRARYGVSPAHYRRDARQGESG